jgi:phage portal protein BeeE
MFLYPLHPAAMHWTPEDGWSFDNGRLRLPSIPDADLVKFRGYNPDSLTRGLSKLEPLRATLENEWAARTATSSFWTRGARPGFALTHKGNLSDTAATRLKAQFVSIAAGADKTGETLILEEGMEPHKLDLTAEEAQYIETRRLNREEVCAAYDVPPPVVHILDRATFSNITEQMRSMYRDTMGNILPGFEAAIELDLRQAEWPDDDVYAEFLLDEVLRGDFEARQTALNQASHMTIAEKRKIENLPFIPGTDRIFLNTATLPLDAIDAQTEALAGGSGEEEPAVPMSVVRTIVGRLAWQRSLDQVDPAVLLRGVTTPSPIIRALAAADSVEDLRARVVALGSREV